MTKQSSDPIPSKTSAPGSEKTPEPLAASAEQADLGQLKPPLGAASVVLAGPLLLLVVHIGVFGSPGMGPLLLLVGAAAASAGLLTLLRGWRTLRSGEVLKRLFRNKRIVYGALGASVFLEALALATGIPAYLWRRDYDSVLEGSDPCAVHTVTDLARATSDQLDHRARRVKACATQRATQALETERAACLALVATLDAGGDVNAHRQILGSFYSIASSAQQQRLDLAQLGSTTPDSVPCERFPSSAASIWNWFAKTSVLSPSPWGQLSKVGELQPVLFKALSSGNFKLSTEADKHLAARLNEVVPQAGTPGRSTAGMAEEHELCLLQSIIGTSRSDACTRLERRYQARLKIEQAEAERQRIVAEARARQKLAADAAAERREEASENAKRAKFEACTSRCDKYTGSPAQWDTCTDRCLGFNEPLF